MYFVITTGDLFFFFGCVQDQVTKQHTPLPKKKLQVGRFSGYHIY